MLRVFPWQETQWQQLQLATRNNRLPHALLVSGPRGIGLDHFSQCISAGLLCRNPVESIYSCGQCKACHLHKSGNHPDVQSIKPEEEGKQIKIDQIRELIDFMNLKSQYEGYKIAIINPSDNMNWNAANTLLKTLEEPPARSLLILLSHRPDRLPVTVRSRCQHIYFQSVFDESAVNWLKDHLTDPKQAEQLLAMANGAPLAALELVQNKNMDKQKMLLDDLELLQRKQIDPIKVAERWNKSDANQMLQWLSLLISDMVRLKSSARPLRLHEADVITRLQRLINGLDLCKLIMCHDLALKNYSLGTGHVSYNSQGLLEDFIIFWQGLNNQQRGQYT